MGIGIIELLVLMGFLAIVIIIVSVVLVAVLRKKRKSTLAPESPCAGGQVKGEK